MLNVPLDTGGLLFAMMVPAVDESATLTPEAIGVPVVVSVKLPDTVYVLPHGRLDNVPSVIAVLCLSVL